MTEKESGFGLADSKEEGATFRDDVPPYEYSPSTSSHVPKEYMRDIIGEFRKSIIDMDARSNDDVVAFIIVGLAFFEHKIISWEEESGA